MNIQKFTQKSLESIQSAQNLAIENQNAQVEEEHLILALLEQEDSLIKELLRKINANEKVEEELNNVLRDLVGKVESDYTEKSWKDLQDAINTAQNAELKSEYDAVKDKLNANNLILEERGFIEGLMKSSCGHGKIILILSAIIVVLLIIIIILGASLSKAKEAATIGRRIK